MHFKSRLGCWLGALLLLGAGAGCDSGGGSAGTGGSAGVGGGPPATTCTLSSQCTNQVCSPDGRCIDCYGTLDCPEGLSCQAERCVAPGTAGGGGGGGASGGGAASGGSGGGSTGAQCAGTQVMFVIQRSGAMFEDPDGDAKYWSMVKDAIAGADGVATVFANKVDMGALFFVRLQYDEDKACPLVSSAAPASGVGTSLATLFDTNASEYEMLAGEQAKMDAPVPEAVTSAAALLTGATKHLVLITTGVPDSCTLADSNCTVDLAIKAVQDAKNAGVTTHVVGLGNTGNLNVGDDGDGYGTYLKQLANAGTGKPVAQSAAFDDQCGDDDATATYADDSGDAQAFKAEDAAAVKTALNSILSSICP